MTLVSSRVSLTHRCTILRNSTATADAWGGRDVPQWQALKTGQVCRGWTTAGRELIRDSSSIVVEDRRLILPVGTDVTERDRIGDVTDRGAIFLDGPMRIEAIIRRPDRLELVLTRVS